MEFNAVSPEENEVLGTLQAPENFEDNGAQTLDAVLASGNEAEQPDHQTETQADKPSEKGLDKEPGWLKGRIDSAVRKANARLRAELEADYERKIAPYREMAIAQQADKLVADGKITDRDLAIQFVRMQQGAEWDSVSEEKESGMSPRNSKGQFVQQDNQQEQAANEAEVREYGNMLIAQARAIKKAGGPDVIAAYDGDQTIKSKVLSREWDFADVAEYLNQSTRPSAPSPVRSPNSGMISQKRIKDMTDDEFNKLNDYLGKGGTVAL